VSLKSRWTGFFTACTTQLKRDQPLDLTAMARQLEALIDCSAREARPPIVRAKREQVLKIIRDALAKRPA
jgi:hypothetical protein